MIKKSWVSSLTAVSTVFILAIILLGLFLRLHHLEKESFWTDESFSVRYALSENLAELLEGVKETEGVPPGHYLLLSYWTRAFGASEFSVRFPSLLFSTLSIFLVFKVGSLLFNRKMGLLAALLSATSMLQIVYAQEARLYSLYGFLVLLITYFFIKLATVEKSSENCRLGRNGWYFVGYAFSLLFALCTNYLAIVLPFLFTLATFWFKNTFPLKRWLVINLLVLSAATPLLPLLLSQFSMTNAGLSADLVKLGLPSALAQLGIFFYALPIFSVLLLAVIFSAFRKRIRLFGFKMLCGERLFVYLILLFSLAYAYLSLRSFSLFGVPFTRYPLTHSFFLIRHSYFLVPLFYFFIAYKLAHLRSKRLAAYGLLALLLTNAFALYVYYETPTKAQWKEAAIFLEERTSVLETPTILLDRGSFGPVFLLQYYSPKPLDVVRLTWIEGRRDRKKLTEEQLIRALEQKKDLWLILSGSDPPDEAYRKLLDRRYRRDFAQDFYLISAYHYTRE